MTYQEGRHQPGFDQFQFALLAPEAERTATLCSQLVRIAMDFANIERVPRYCMERRENNAEHSFMLALVATELARQFRPDLSTGLVAQFSIVHDLPELKTDDTATFNITETALQAKEQREKQATTELVRTTLPPYIGSLLLRYEEQEEPESQYVRLVDKLLPVAVDIHGPGRQVMEEDYGVYTLEQLNEAEAQLSDRFRRKFPDPRLTPLHLARGILAHDFAKAFAAEEEPIMAEFDC